MFNSSGDAVYVVNFGGDIHQIRNRTLETYRQVEEETAFKAQLADDLEFLAIESRKTVHLYQNQGTRL